MFYLKFKRFMDFILSLIALIVLSPIFLPIVIFIKLDSSGPALFVQERSGLHKKTFNIYKFRTMTIEAPKNCATYLLDNHESYITRVGNFLRKTSLDEIPQLLNILKGDMSIVGPRPVICKEQELIELRDKYGANDILPGLTGWAQINGRDTVCNDDKAKYDGYYVKNIGIKMDIKCFFGTIVSVLQRDGIFEGNTELCEKESKATRIRQTNKVRQTGSLTTDE